MLEATGPGGELSEGEAIGIIDQFALQHRLPNGKAVLDQFTTSRPDWLGCSDAPVRSGTTRYPQRGTDGPPRQVWRPLCLQTAVLPRTGIFPRIRASKIPGRVQTRKSAECSRPIL